MGPDWLHGGEANVQETNESGISLLDVIAWIAGLAAIADVLYLAHHYLG
jgi:hypothetical protein